VFGRMAAGRSASELALHRRVSAPPVARPGQLPAASGARVHEFEPLSPARRRRVLRGELTSWPVNWRRSQPCSGDTPPRRPKPCAPNRRNNGYFGQYRCPLLYKRSFIILIYPGQFWTRD
jgi:hypothetical protein